MVASDHVHVWMMHGSGGGTDDVLWGDHAQCWCGAMARVVSPGSQFINGPSLDWTVTDELVPETDG